jgi:hypothetical protein
MTRGASMMGRGSQAECAAADAVLAAAPPLAKQSESWLLGPGPEVQSSNTAPNSQIGNDYDVTVDWLTLVQDHPKAPLLGKNLLLFLDLTTGEVESQAVKSLQHEGSFSSKLLIRADGRRVEVSGNPSRWGVAHSLDGLKDVSGALALYNDVVASLKLPRFSQVERAFVAPVLPQRGDTLIPEGARITRLDLAQLFETADSADVGAGRVNAAVTIRALGQVVHQGKTPMVYGNGETVAWGSGSRHVYVKYYDKGAELLKRASPEVLPAANWACAVGLIRHEVTLKSMWLKKHGLDLPGKWTGDVMRNVMQQYAMHDRVGVARSGWAKVYEQLLGLGIPASRARRAQEAAYAYLGGHVFRRGKPPLGNIPNGSFYRLRADLRLVGLDIAAPLNVSALHCAVRVVEMRRAYLPVGFRRAG